MPDNLSPAQIALRNGQIVLCEQFGRGGEKWTVERASGDEITETTTIIPQPKPIRVYARLVSIPGQQSSTGAGPIVPVQEWRLFDFGARPGAFSEQDLQPGDRITSSANPAIRFSVGGRDRRAGYTTYKIAPYEQ